MPHGRKLTKQEIAEMRRQKREDGLHPIEIAKNFGVGNEGLSMSIGKNSKRITHFIVDYNRGRDLYNLEFVRMWGGRRISVKKLKGVYFDDLQYNFKRYTGLNTRL